MKKMIKNDSSTLVTPNVGEMLLIKGPLHAIKIPYEDSQRSKSSTHGAPLEARFVIIDDGSCTNVTPNTLIDKL